MDILKKYDQQYPEMIPQSLPSDLPQEFQEEGFLIWLIIKMSGGKIRHGRQARMALLGVAIILLLITFFIISQNVNLFPAKRFTDEEARKQLEEYKKIQPF